MFHIFAGSGQVKSLEYRYKLTGHHVLPNVEGNGPDKLLLYSCKWVAQSTLPTQSGIEPPILLVYNTKLSIVSAKPDHDVGIFHHKRLLEKCMYDIASSPLPRSAGNTHPKSFLNPYRWVKDDISRISSGNWTVRSLSFM